MCTKEVWYSGIKGDCIITTCVSQVWFLDSALHVCWICAFANQYRALINTSFRLFITWSLWVIGHTLVQSSFTSIPAVKREKPGNKTSCLHNRPSCDFYQSYYCYCYYQRCYQSLIEKDLLGDWSPEKVIFKSSQPSFTGLQSPRWSFSIKIMLLLGSNHFLIVIIIHYHQLWLTVFQCSNCCYQSSVSDISIITQTYNIHIKHPTQLEQNEKQTRKKNYYIDIML